MAAGSRARGRARGGVGRHLAVPLVMVLVFGGIAGGSYLALERYGSPAHEGTCVASGLGTSHRYTTDRVANAALISATAVDRGMPPRAASIALATAYQESQLQNIDYGDRDSLGLFQQRPSQGWGTEEQIMDPVYASNAFFDVLETYPDYISADINDIAQQVQRSGHPEAYRDHETEGRLYASALTGQSGANLLCTLDEVGATASPEQLRGELARQFPRATESGRRGRPAGARGRRRDGARARPGRRRDAGLVARELGRGPCGRRRGGTGQLPRPGLGPHRPRRGRRHLGQRRGRRSRAGGRAGQRPLNPLSAR